MITATLESTTPSGAPPPSAPPSIRGEPWFGSLRAYRDDRLGFLVRAARHGDVVSMRLGPRTFHLIAHPEGVKRVLIDNAANYHKETRGQELMRPLLGEGLLTAEGEAWKSQRRLAQPAFQRDRVAGFAPIMVEATRDVLEAWAPRARTGESFDLAEEMSKLTFRIVGLAIFGTDLGDTAEEVGRSLSIALLDRTERTTSLLDYFLGERIPTPRNRRFQRALRSLDSVVARTIAARRSRPPSVESSGSDLLTLLGNARDPETGAGLSDRLLRDQVMTILLAGHETTANALSWTFYLLSTHPEVERRVCAEVESVLSGREPTAEDAARLRYTRAVVDESMRLYPPVWTMARNVVEDDVLSGKRVGGGSYVWISPFVTHRHPDFWENPEGFDPERFLDPAPGRPRFAHFPFGGGARQCIGNTFALLEAVVILAMALQRYRIELVPGATVTPEPLITLRPRGGVPVRIRSRR